MANQRITNPASYDAWTALILPQVQPGRGVSPAPLCVFMFSQKKPKPTSSVHLYARCSMWMFHATVKITNETTRPSAADPTKGRSPVSVFMRLWECRRRPGLAARVWTTSMMCSFRLETCPCPYPDETQPAQPPQGLLPAYLQEKQESHDCVISPALGRNARFRTRARCKERLPQ
jgi:hypothetical protein